VVKLEGTTDALSRPRRLLPNRAAGPRILRAVPPVHGPYLTNVADARLNDGHHRRNTFFAFSSPGRWPGCRPKRDATGFGRRESDLTRSSKANAKAAQHRLARFLCAASILSLHHGDRSNERSLFFYSPCVINAQPQVGFQCVLQLRASMLAGNL
jgi:hypothetical protein